MKKLHILIPSLTIASALPALMAISCGSDGSATWKQSDGEFKWVHDTPKFEVPTWIGTSEYFKRVSKKILADDFVKSRADAVNDSDSTVHYKNWNINVTINEIDKENHRCSFVIRESGDREIWYGNDYMHYDYTATLVDMPISMMHSEDFDYWYGEVDGIARSVGPLNSGEYSLDEMYHEYNTWSFTIKGTIQDTQYDDVINYDCLDDLETETHQGTLHVLDSVSWTSYFFKNVTVKEG